jgi:hypothetical protein
MAAAYEMPGDGVRLWSSVAEAEAESPLCVCAAPRALEPPAAEGDEASVADAPLAAAVNGRIDAAAVAPGVVAAGELAAAGLSIVGVDIVEGKGFEAAGEVIGGNGLAEGLPL